MGELKRRLIAGTINRYPAEAGWENVHLDASYRSLFDEATGRMVPVDIHCRIEHLDEVVGPQSFDEIRCHQTLEHLMPWDGKAALHQFHRALKPGGRLDITVPNLAAVAKKFATGEYTFGQLIQSCYGEQFAEMPDGDLMVHRNGFNEESLAELLEETSFDAGPPMGTDGSLQFFATKRGS